LETSDCVPPEADDTDNDRDEEVNIHDLNALRTVSFIHVPSADTTTSIPSEDCYRPNSAENETRNLKEIKISDRFFGLPSTIPSLKPSMHQVTRGEFDTGAGATVTDNKDILHDFRLYDENFPCPIRLRGATDINKTSVPIGEGNIHVPGTNHLGYNAVRTFYSPDLNSTLINDQDLYDTSVDGAKNSDFEGLTLTQHRLGKTCTITCHHRLRRSQDIVIHGIMSSDRSPKWYSHPLIYPDLHPTHPDANIYTSSEFALQHDTSFKTDHETAIRREMHLEYERQICKVTADLEYIDEKYHSLPFHEYIYQSIDINTIRAKTLRLLWHQRLGHPSDYYLYSAHKFVDGVPKFQHEDKILEACPTCIQAKPRKTAPGHNSTRSATRPWQGLSIDFSFSGTISRDKTTGKENMERRKDFVGLNGETSWILVSDHFSRYMIGDTRLLKASPIYWLQNQLSKHSDPFCKDKYVYLDQGGELYRNPIVRSIFERYGYDVRPTGSDSSHQNGPVERAHLTIANGIRSMLVGAKMDVPFWPYAFHHYLRIKNAIPSRDQQMSPLEMATGIKDDFSKFRTFGCRIWARPTERRPAKFKTNLRKGIFLGFLPNTTKLIMYYDVDSKRVKTAFHVRFDEGMNDLPIDAIPPNVLHLQRSQDGAPILPDKEHTAADDFRFYTEPFANPLNKVLTIACTDPNFGLEFEQDSILGRAYVSAIHPKSSAASIFSSLKATRRKLLGAYILSVDDTPVFDAKQVQSKFEEIQASDAAKFTIVFATEAMLTTKDHERGMAEFYKFAPGSLGVDKSLNTIKAIHSIDPAFSDFISHEPELDYDTIRAIAALRFDVDTSEQSLPSEMIDLVINAISSSAITPEEQALGHYTRQKLKSLSTWDKWKAGEMKQLDQMHALRMYGEPQRRPSNAIVLRIHWQYTLKRCGEQRSRNCCDGSKRAAPLLHAVASTYSSCVEQPIQRLFFALAAQQDLQVYGGDAVDAYAHSPPPENECYVSVDDAYIEWFKERYPDKYIDKSMVLPVQHALQGHPEAGRLWESHINSILAIPELNFVNTVHDKCIYSATIEGEKVLLLRQVDDFSLACTNEALAKRIYDIIGQHLKLDYETAVPFKYLGLVNDYNGVDVRQTADYTELCCPGYIDRLLRSHGWETPSKDEIQSRPFSPMPEDAQKHIFTSAGPLEGTKAHAALAEKMKFAFRTLLGELLYAYVTCRPDIGYAVVTLSKFSTCPSEAHYIYLKNIARYLRRTKNWGIRFFRSTKNTSLPTSDYSDPPVPSNDLPSFPYHPLDRDLVCFVDAAYANDLRNRRSTTGYALCLAGAAIVYRSKTQTVTALSSTEAEFYAAVAAAKIVRYIRMVLADLGYKQHNPTVIYEDNASAINIINSRTPTERSRHIDTPYFAIQDWKADGSILMKHIPGIINPSDDLTKPLGWVLHARHARRLMGHFRP
jgi:hypothetical protein